MRRLEPTWVRVIVSFFVGGFISELAVLLTFDPDKPQSTSIGIHLFFGVIVYFVLTWYVKRFIKNTPPPL
jgi:hypothetical protein